MNQLQHAKKSFAECDIKIGDIIKVPKISATSMTIDSVIFEMHGDKLRARLGATLTTYSKDYNALPESHYFVNFLLEDLLATKYTITGHDTETAKEWSDLCA